MEAMRQTWSDDRLDHLNARVDEGFRNVDERFKQVDARFDRIEHRLDNLDARFDRLQHTIWIVGGGLMSTLIATCVAALAAT
jgi:hypothetical protein